MTASLAQAQNFAQQLNAEGLRPPTVDECRENTTRKGCEIFSGLTTQADCSNPQFAATNQVCLRQANDPRCAHLDSMLKPSQNNGFGGSGEKFEGVKVNGISGNSGLAGSDGGAPIMFGAGGAAQGGSLNEPLQKQAPQSAPASIKTNILGRMSNGDANLFNRLIGNSISSNKGPEQPLQTSNYKNLPNAKKKIDLTQYLPGGALYPKRRIRSVTEPDGINRPFTDLFQKITARYMSIGHTMK